MYIYIYIYIYIIYTYTTFSLMAIMIVYNTPNVDSEIYTMWNWSLTLLYIDIQNSFTQHII